MSSSAIGGHFERICRERGDAAAVHVLADRVTVSFRDLREQYRRVLDAMRRLGLGDGVCIVARVGNRPQFWPVLAAALECGASLLPLGETTDAEAAALVATSACAAIVTDRAVGGIPTSSVDIGDGLQLSGLAQPDVRTYGRATVLKLTSGSTDLPKAALAREAHLIADGRHVIEAMGIGPADLNAGCIPLSHSYALGNIVMPLILQGTAVALRQSFSPGQFLSDAQACGTTVFPGVPFMFDHLRRHDGLDRLPDRLRLLISAGARLDPATVRWFLEQVDRKIHSFYGSSETGGITYDDTDTLEDPMPVGRPMPGTGVTVREPDQDGVGRLFVTGDAVVDGYVHGASDDTVNPFVDGGFLTSDLGYLEPGGHLVLTGRVSALVNVAGLKVDPAEVERVLAAIPGVAESRVMGLADATRGQQIIALIVRSDPSVTAIAIRQRCAISLSPYKIPRHVLFLDRLPVDSRGKVDRRALEALAAENLRG